MFGRGIGRRVTETIIGGEDARRLCMGGKFRRRVVVGTCGQSLLLTGKQLDNSRNTISRLHRLLCWTFLIPTTISISSSRFSLYSFISYFLVWSIQLYGCFVFVIYFVLVFSFYFYLCFALANFSPSCIHLVCWMILFIFYAIGYENKQTTHWNKQALNPTPYRESNIR